jgi:hypothetical protein
MALDSRILLTQTTPNLMQALQSGISAGQALRQAPLIEALQRQRLAQGQAQMAQQQALQPLQRQLIESQIAAEQAKLSAPPEDKNLFEIRKEVRKSVGDNISKISADASAVKTNFGKLQNLVGEVEKGNRSAVAQALVSLVKLGDPGSVVKEEEMKAALANKSPIAALADTLQAKGVSGDVSRSVMATMDPLNPGNIKTGELMRTAGALMGANVPVIQERFAVQKDRAGRNLTEQGFKSIFSDRLEQTISDLSNVGAVDNSTADIDSEIEALRAELFKQ